MTDKRFYLEKLREEEIVESLIKSGYSVERDVDVDGTRVDIIARKDGEIKAFEVKAFGSMGEDYLQNITMLRNKLIHHNIHNLELIVANRETPKQITFDDLDTILFDYLAQETISDIDQLSSHSRLEGISNAEIESIEIDMSTITVSGSCTVEAVLAYGSWGDDDSLEVEYSFPATYSADIDTKSFKADSVEISVDTSSFSE